MFNNKWSEQVEVETLLVPARTVQTAESPKDHPVDQDIPEEEAPIQEAPQQLESIATSRPRRDI
jgi:hypothetical protein